MVGSRFAGLAAAAVLSTCFLVPPAALAAGDPVIAAAGDIACDPTDANFNNGMGTAAGCQQQATSDLLVNHGYTAVLPLGDNQYGADATDYSQVYDPTWGRVKAITHPAAGNHDYDVAGASGYFGYFGAAAGNPNQGWYSYDIGSWHVVVLNSNCGEVGGCSTGSAQEQWLRQDLAAHPSACTLAYWHHPRWTSSGVVQPDTEVTPLWQDLYAAGADLILNGHAHEYERFAPMAPDGSADPTYGIREFVVGTGGAESDQTAPTAANSQRLSIGSFGVLALTLHSGSYDYAFQPATGSTLTDAGSGTCHDAPPATVPSAPGAVDGTPGNGQVTVSWAPPANSGTAPISTYTVTASPGGATVTVSGSTAAATVSGLTNGTSYTFTVSAANSGGSGPPSAPSRALTPAAAASGTGYASSVLADFPTAYYRLGESSGTTSVDSSGLGRTGVYKGGVALGLPGAVSANTAAGFDGSTGYATIADATPLRLNGPFTIELWAKSCTFANSWPGLLTKGSAGTADGYLIWYTSNGVVHFKRNNFDIATPAGAVGCGSYSHLALTYDGSTARWYVNGSLVASKALAYPIDAGSAPLLLGRGDQAGNESLDEVAIYSSALSQSRLSAHIASAAGAQSSPPPSVNAPGAPTNVTATAGNAAATVSWTAPASDGGSAITSYSVLSNDGRSVTVGGTTTTATVTGLANGSTYTFTVAAANSVGSGPASTPSNAVTPMTVPTAPTNVTAAAGDGSATLAWSAPASDGGGTISAYVVASSDGRTLTVSGGARSATMSGLTNGLSYTFTVTANNAAGSSSASAPSNTVVPAAAPSAGYAASVLADNPIGYWRLGESSGTTATDASGQGFTGTYSAGSALGQPGALLHDPDTAVAFNGSSGSCSIPDRSPLRLNGPFSIEFWAKETSFANSWPGLMMKGAAATANGYLIWYSSNGALHFKRNNIDIATPAGALVANAWHAYDVTYDGTTLRWYVDGKQAASRAVAFPALAGTEPLQLGRGDQYGNEAMDEVAIFATALSPSRISAHYAAATT